MTRELPTRPNLEFLRKQAKHLLDELRTTKPEAMLADAQHTLAMEYGFASWRKLKTHVESILDAAGESVSTENDDSPFAGRWVANVARSRRHPLNLFRRAFIDIAVDQNLFTLTHAYIDANGRAEHGESLLQVDGEVHERGNGYAVRATWVGHRAFETSATKDGELIGEGRYEVSDDGSRLTITAPEQVLVLDRRSPV